MQVEAKKAYLGRRCYIHVSSAFTLTRDYQAVFGWGSDILFDGVARREVCSKGELKSLFRQHDAGFACARSCWFP
jgi:hypothetical protein